MRRHASTFALAASLALAACRTTGAPAPAAAPAPRPAPAATGPASPADAPSGLVGPRPRARECVGNAMRIPRRLVGVTMELVAHLAISAHGEARVVRVEGTEDQALADALAVALAGCPFEPATLFGEPVEAAYVLPIRFTHR